MPCGEELETDGLLVHPHVCHYGASRLRPHRAITKLLGRAIRATGAIVDYERHVPDLYLLNPETRQVTEAIMDAVVVWPGDCQEL